MAYTDTEFDYQPESLEGAIFLSEIPIGLMKEQLTTQFKDPVEYRKKDVISSFIDKYDQSANFEISEEESDHLDELRDDFITFVKDLFYNYLGVGFVNLEDENDVDEQHEVLHITYRFFLRNMKRNFVNVILNYIDKNRDELAATLSRKKDITSLSLKKEIQDPDDIIIVANLSDVVDKVFDEYLNGAQYDIMDFIKDTDYDSPSLESEYVYGKYDKDEITGNFLPQYIGMVDVDFRREIESKVRTKFIKKNHR